MKTQINKIKKAYYLLIVALGVFSVAMIFAAWYASSIAPKLMQQNYLSVRYSSQMEQSLVAVYLAESSGKEVNLLDLKTFDESLENAKNNITETGEKELLDKLNNDWFKFKNNKMTPVVEQFQNLQSDIRELTEINEHAMYLLRDRSHTLGLTIVSAGVFGLFLILMYAFLYADKQFESISFTENIG